MGIVDTDIDDLHDHCISESKFNMRDIQIKSIWGLFWVYYRLLTIAVMGIVLGVSYPKQMINPVCR
jgi:hypothetical protein